VNKHIEVVQYGQTKTVLVVFYEPGTELKFSAVVYLKDIDYWWYPEGIPATSWEDAFEFFQTVAEAWGGDRPSCQYVYNLECQVCEEGMDVNAAAC
jgi:hypothetical protein